MSQSQSGSEFDQLFYPGLFASPKTSVNVADVLQQVTMSTRQKCQETIALRREIHQNAHHQLVTAAKAMAERFAQGAMLLAMGNGGSSTDCQDLVADFMDLDKSSGLSLPVLALTHDVAAMTAIANDVGFENVFVRQVIAFGKPGDIAMGFSTSGNSENVVLGLAQAKRQGLLTIAISGYDGGKLAQNAAIDYCFVARNEHTPRIQEGQATIAHILVRLVKALMTSRS
ncbi:D-sedoheptulose-7-phosphate isomerase [Sulfobacillus thermosulfidooxidans]|uniref:D-sedoheptulose-7-phosphate isomerase n=1 Tax=Sulfobacillus thermosulfidooxidans TaxID=28034 RepID=UPI0006B649DC|nr:SIS domain-containing protein [Sulfobacillus thermosulfidooxidans]